MFRSHHSVPLHPTEIQAGVVLHLDPEALAAHGATCTCNPQLRVKEPHFFLCLAVLSSASRWVPLYSEDGPGRASLPPSGRTGHPKWTNGNSYFHPDQTWTASASAIIAAAAAGKDRSWTGHRNMLAPELIPAA